MACSLLRKGGHNQQSKGEGKQWRKCRKGGEPLPSYLSEIEMLLFTELMIKNVSTS